MCSDYENVLLRDLPDEATKFFAVFSRFEFALKQAGYLESHVDGKNAEPGWDCFARNLTDTFFQTVKESDSAKVLFDKPPKKQIVQGNSIDWKVGRDIIDIKELFLAVRCVRNNLFHGGKFQTGPVEEPSRDKALLNACLFVLEEALGECGKQSSGSKLKELRGHFFDPL
ncbi:MAG: hypothetical protein HQL44_03095 [Alphaproteobacteria bacterium]|nr:hypothetical protein [Alphaproteobacteria bacterium]